MVTFKTSGALPSDLAAAHAIILAEREAWHAAETAGAAAKLALGIEIEGLKLETARLRRERFGPSSERSARLEQLELRLEDLEEAAGEAAASQADEPGRRCGLRATQARSPPFAGAPSTSAHRASRTAGVSVLWRDGAA